MKDDNDIDKFKVTPNQYSSYNVNHTQIVQDLYGPNYRVANWADIEQHYQKYGLDDLIQKAGLATSEAQFMYDRIYFVNVDDK